MRRASRTATLAGAVLLAVLAVQTAPALAAPLTATFLPLADAPVAGNSVELSARFSGSVTGTASFKLYRPGSSCNPASPDDVLTVDVSGDTKVDRLVSLTSSGRYFATVEFKGDSSADDIEADCLAKLVIDAGPRKPSISVKGPKGTVTGPIRATATLGGAFKPSKGVTFTVVREADCSSIVAGKSGVSLAPSSLKAEAEFSLPDGSYRLIARYEDGDASNLSVSSGCGDDVVTVKNPEQASQTNSSQPSPPDVVPSLRLVSTKGNDLLALPRKGDARLDFVASNNGSNAADRTITVDLGGLKPVGPLEKGLARRGRGKTIAWTGSVPVGTTKLFSIRVRTRKRASVTVSGENVAKIAVSLTRETGRVKLTTGSPSVRATEGSQITLAGKAAVARCVGKFKIQFRAARKGETSTWTTDTVPMTQRVGTAGDCQLAWDVSFSEGFAKFVAAYKTLQFRVLRGDSRRPVSPLLVVRLSN